MIPHAGMIAKVIDSNGNERIITIADCLIVIRDRQGIEYINSTNGKNNIIDAISRIKTYPDNAIIPEHASPKGSVFYRMWAWFGK